MDFGPAYIIAYNEQRSCSDLVRMYQKKQLIFARTSNEIKNSVGAVAKPMYSYVKQNCVLSNWFTTQLLNYFNDPKPWVTRMPFK